MAERVFRVFDQNGTAILEVSLGANQTVSEPKERTNEFGQITRKGEVLGPARVEEETFVSIIEKPKRKAKK